MHPIKRERARQKMSLRELADRSGVHYGSISMIERGGRTPTIVTLAKLGDALGVDVEVLTGEREAPKAGPTPEPEPIVVRPTGHESDRRAFGEFTIEVKPAVLEEVLVRVWEHELQPPQAMRELIGAGAE